MPATRIRSTAPLRPAAVGVAGLGLIGALAGCAATTGTTAEGTDGGGTTSTAHYKDGSYASQGDYQSPGGHETIDVRVTLKSDEVTAITVTPNASSGNAKKYQTAFSDGISEKVTGKRIDELTDVTRVSGSSLTSGGFQKAIEKIQSLAEA